MPDILFPTPIETYIRFQSFRDLVRDSAQSELAAFLRETELVGITDELADLLYAKTAAVWGVNASECKIVGSARLGFSPIEKKDGRTGEVKLAGRSFSEGSDIDVAIISSSLFDEVWRDLFRFAPHYVQWHQVDDFRKYLYRGWLRPDKMPYNFSGRIKWFDLCNEVSAEVLDSLLKVTVALYKSPAFFEASMNVSAYGIRSRLMT